MQNTIITSLSIHELKKLFIECLENYLSNGKYQCHNSEDEKLNQTQAAKLLGISQPTIISYKKKGIIPFHQLPGSRRIYYLKSELQKVSSQNAHLLNAAQ